MEVQLGQLWLLIHGKTKNPVFVPSENLDVSAVPVWS